MSEIYLVFDPIESAWSDFPEPKDAIAYAKGLMDGSLDDEAWDATTEEIVIVTGRVTHAPVRYDVMTRPDDIDEDGYSPSLGLDWPEQHDEIWKYKIEKVATADPPKPLTEYQEMLLKVLRWVYPGDTCFDKNGVIKVANERPYLTASDTTIIRAIQALLASGFISVKLKGSGRRPTQYVLVQSG